VLLRSGDEIELGQVQLRFVSGEGEFGAALGGPAKRKRYGIAIGGAWLWRWFSPLRFRPGRDGPGRRLHRRRRRRPAAPVVEPPAPKQTLEDLLAAAKSAQADEKWD